MLPPESAEIFETAASIYWFEGDLLFVVSKKVAEPDMEIRKKQMQEFRQKLGERKICAIMDVSDAAPSSREAREYNSVELPKMFRAIAFIITKPLTRMLAQLYLGARPLSFPVKMCSNEKEALEWIRQFL